MVTDSHQFPPGSTGTDILSSQSAEEQCQRAPDRSPSDVGSVSALSLKGHLSTVPPFLLFHPDLFILQS